MEKDMTLIEGDAVEYWDGDMWNPGTIEDVDRSDEKHPYQIRGLDGYTFWGNSAYGVRRPADHGEPAAPQLYVRENPEKLPSVPDMVNEPPHYNSHPKGIECIEVIEDNPFLTLGNAMKYLWRVSWGGKGNDEEDLRKAIWYIERELQRRGH